MVITVTQSKYQVGCGRGYGIEIPNLVLKLNLIVDKDRSEWPKPTDTRTQEEIDSGVPEPVVKTELEEGDVFELEGTVFAIDHDRLVQIVSETGGLAIKRIYEETIKPELEFSYFDDEENDYSWEEVDSIQPEFSDEYSMPYSWMKVWKDNFVKDRNLRPKYIIKVTITDSILGFKREIYITPSKVLYSGNQFSEEEIEWYIKKVLSWFYVEIGRVKEI